MEENNLKKEDIEKLSEHITPLEKEQPLVQVLENEEETKTSPKKHRKEKTQLTKLDKVKFSIVKFLSSYENLLFLGILIMTLVLRLKFIGQESIWNDTAVHLWYVIKVTQEPLFFFSQQYLGGDYAIPQTIMAFFYLFTKNAFTAGKIVAVLYSLVGVTFMYMLGTELKNKRTGLIAALLLATNHIFWFYSVRPLADSPMLVTTIILLYAMVKLEKEKTRFWGIAAGLMFLVCMFTKVQSVIFVLALLIYYVLFKRKEMFKHRPTLYSWLIPVVFITVADIAVRVLFGAKLVGRVFTLFLTQRGMPFGFEAWGMLQWIFTWQLFVLMAIALLFILAYKEKRYYFPIVLFITYWLFFEVNVDNTQDRYVIPLLSLAVLFAAFAIDELAHYLKIFIDKRARPYVQVIFILLVVGFISFGFYETGNSLIEGRMWSYAGHEEAGLWIQENVPEDIPIFAGSPRMSLKIQGIKNY